jgi:RNA polymerase sigma factor (sigma-70 family)
MTDRQLLDRFLAARDEEAFAELVRRHAPGVWGACRRRLAHVQDAEDAFQATFLVLVRRAARLRAGTPLGPWLGKVAALTARNVARGNRRRAAVTGPLEHDHPAAVPAEPAVDLDAALRHLPEPDRAAVVLCHLDGLSRKEAAERLGCPEGTLSARLSRALGKLRRRLADEVPPGLVRSTVRVAVVVGASSGPAGVSPAVAQLAEEAIRMLWVKKLTAAGLVLAAAGMVGLGVVRTADAGGQEKGPGAAPAAKADKPAADRVAEVERQLRAAWSASAEQQILIARLSDELRRLRGPDPGEPRPAPAADPVADLQKRLADAEAAAQFHQRLAQKLRDELGQARPKRADESRKPPAADPVADLKRQLDQAEAEVKAAQGRMSEALQRREFLHGRLTLAQQAAAKEAPADDRPLLHVFVAREAAVRSDAEARFWLIEMVGGRPVRYFAPPVGSLPLLLARAKADPNGPRRVYVEAQAGANPADIGAALLAVKAAGFKTVDYDGPGLEGSFISPGPGTITPGKKPGDPGRFSGPIDLSGLKDPPNVEKK